jgi:hypothetical protein
LLTLKQATAGAADIFQHVAQWQSVVSNGVE